MLQVSYRVNGTQTPVTVGVFFWGGGGYGGKRVCSARECGISSGGARRMRRRLGVSFPEGVEDEATGAVMMKMAVTL